MLVHSYITEQIPEEITPLNWRAIPEPNLLIHRHGIAWTNLIRLVRQHSDNIHHSHQLFRPAKKTEEFLISSIGEYEYIHKFYYVSSKLSG